MDGWRPKTAAELTLVAAWMVRKTKPKLARIIGAELRNIACYNDADAMAERLSTLGGMLYGKE